MNEEGLSLAVDLRILCEQPKSTRTSRSALKLRIRCIVRRVAVAAVIAGLR